jgi:hypothetical protein
MLKTVSENVAVSHVCVLNWLKDSVRDVGPWKWSKGWVGIHCSKSGSSSTSSETGGHRPPNVSEIKDKLDINWEMTYHNLHKDLGKRKDTYEVHSTQAHGQEKGAHHNLFRFTPTSLIIPHFVNCITTKDELWCFITILKQNIREWHGASTSWHIAELWSATHLIHLTKRWPNISYSPKKMPLSKDENFTSRTLRVLLMTVLWNF